MPLDTKEVAHRNCGNLPLLSCTKKRPCEIALQRLTLTALHFLNAEPACAIAVKRTLRRPSLSPSFADSANLQMLTIDVRASIITFPSDLISLNYSSTIPCYDSLGNASSLKCCSIDIASASGIPASLICSTDASLIFLTDPKCFSSCCLRFGPTPSSPSSAD